MDKCMMVEHGRLVEKEREESGQIKTGDLIQLSDSNFDEHVNKYDLILVDFWAPWCGPCRVISPVIEWLSKEYAGKAVFGKLKVDDNPLTASRFGVISIPTILFLKKGREVDRIVEVVTKNIIKNKIEDGIAV